jgi:hopanoid biosynthesis associated protein HpnK
MTAPGQETVIPGAAEPGDARSRARLPSPFSEPTMACRLIINVDDLGWSRGVNDAVCALYDEGVITSTSLMVAAPAAGDAVRRVRTRPGLAVGLHLALVCAPSLLPPATLPRLTGGHGPLSDRHLAAAARCTLDPAARRDLEREVLAQLQAFARLGLGWSHLDFHLHFSLTPVVFRTALRLGAAYPFIGLRVPEDDYALYRTLDPVDALRKPLLAASFSVLCSAQRRALRATGLRTTRRCYGLFRSGRLDAEYLSRLVYGMPDGDLELHCHPDLSTPGGRAEFEALRSRRFQNALRERGVVLATYATLGGTRSEPLPRLVRHE